MARINLLPWREELRKQRQRDFVAAIALSLLATAGILFFVHSHINGLIEYQGERNRFLQNEIAGLDRKIKEIESLEEQKALLLAKMEVIQRLQMSRPEIVHLFDELAKTVPDGVHLTKFVQSGDRLTFDGKAESNASVSAYMRKIEKSPWLQNPSLNIIQSDKKTGSQTSNDFTLFAVQGRKKPAETEEGE